jgi:hypothetical protein
LASWKIFHQIKIRARAVYIYLEKIYKVKYGQDIINFSFCIFAIANHTRNAEKTTLTSSIANQHGGLVWLGFWLLFADEKSNPPEVLDERRK